MARLFLLFGKILEKSAEHAPIALRTAPAEMNFSYQMGCRASDMAITLLLIPAGAVMSPATNIKR
jgi:hypothetical protein